MRRVDRLQEAANLEHEGDIQACIGTVGLLGGGFGAGIAIGKLENGVTEAIIAVPCIAIAVGGAVMLALGVAKIIRSAGSEY